MDLTVISFWVWVGDEKESGKIIWYAPALQINNLTITFDSEFMHFFVCLCSTKATINLSPLLQLQSCILLSLRTRVKIRNHPALQPNIGVVYTTDTYLDTYDTIPSFFYRTCFLARRQRLSLTPKIVLIEIGAVTDTIFSSAAWYFLPKLQPC